MIKHVRQSQLAELGKATAPPAKLGTAANLELKKGGDGCIIMRDSIVPVPFPYDWIADPPPFLPGGAL